MIRIAVCDDEKIAVRWISEEIKKSLVKYGEDFEIRTYSSGNTMRKEILGGQKVDVIFLDISMPDIDGIFLARHLKEMEAECQIVFVSSKEEDVFRSFSASPFRFIRKSSLKEEMDGVIRDLLAERKKNGPESITLKYRQSVITLNPYRLIYVESYGKSQSLHTGAEVLEINCRLKELQVLLEPYGFLKPHNSYLVNYRFINSIRQTQLCLDNGEILPISKHRLADVKENYLALISRNG